MEYIDLRKVGREGRKEIRRQIVRLKKLGKTGKEIEELTGVRQNRASEIWTAYQREGEISLGEKYGRKAGRHMVLTASTWAWSWRVPAASGPWTPRSAEWRSPHWP